MKNLPTHKSLLFLLLLILAAACEEEIILDRDLTAPKIVVNSFIEPDSLITVKLFRDIPINSSVISTEIPNATVILYEDGIKKEQLKMVLNIYEQPTYVNPGEFTTDTLYTYVSETTRAAFGIRYTLEVSRPGFETVSTETTIPKPVEVVSIDTFSVLKKEQWWTGMDYHFKLRFKDPAEDTNYYRIIIQQKRGSLPYHSDSADSLNIYINGNMGSSYFNSEDPIFSFETEDANNYIFGSSWNEYGVFSDELINGKEYELNFYQSDGYSDEYEFRPDKGEFKEYTILLQSITYDMFLYLKSIDLQSYNDNMPFTEPVPIYNNVENGLGIFGSYSSASISIMYGEYPMEGVTYQ